MTGPYINDPNFLVPDNKIVVVPLDLEYNEDFLNIIEPLAGKVKRDWFNDHFYYCLPINIGNQYGFIVKSLRTFDVTWNGSTTDSQDLNIEFLDDIDYCPQSFTAGFSNGILTIQNNFHFKTPLGINLMTIQPPNMFIPGMAAMTGVVETDQLRRDFTFNMKITIPNYKIRVNRGDAIGAFIPIQRHFVENFSLAHVQDLFDKQLHENELSDGEELSRQRSNEDKFKPHESGRKYFHGTHAFGDLYSDHQKRVRPN
jgi:hypothetical protein